MRQRLVLMLVLAIDGHAILAWTLGPSRAKGDRVQRNPPLPRKDQATTCLIQPAGDAAVDELTSLPFVELSNRSIAPLTWSPSVVSSWARPGLILAARAAFSAAASMRVMMSLS